MNRKLIIGLLLISVGLVLTACGSSDSGQGEEVENAALLEIHASNFQFDQTEYVVKAGEPVKIQLVNDEGYHGIAIRGLGVNLDGNESTVITPDEPGEYSINCSVLCGTGHADMVAKLIVE